MYPPSGFPVVDSGARRAALSRTLALVAASVAFVAYELIFRVFAPGPVRIEYLGTRVPSCSIHWNAKQPNTLCQAIHPDPWLPLRIAIAVVALGLVVRLSVASYRAALHRPVGA